MNVDNHSSIENGKLPPAEPQATQRPIGRTRASVWLRRAAATDAAFVIFLAVIAVMRFRVVDSVAEPSGIDPGNWLAFGHTLFGSQSRSSSIVYPPLIPLMTMGLDRIWGPLRGAQLLAVISSLAPSAGSYVLLRGGLGPRALLIAGFVAPAASTGEAAAWGGYPQLLGLGLLCLVLWSLDRFIGTRRLAWAVASSILLFLTVATSDLIGAAAIVIASLFVLLRGLFLPKSERPSRGLVVQGFLIGAIPLLALAPTYFALIGGVLHNQATKGPNQTAYTNLRPYLDNIFKDDVGLWYVLLMIALVSPLILVVRRGQPFATASAAILVPTAFVLAIAGELRFAFLLPIGIAAGLAAWLALVSGSKRLLAVILDRVLIAALALLLFVESYLGIAAFQQQVAWYETLTPGEVAGLYQLDSLAPRDVTFAVSPGPGRAAVQGWPFGWWVEGLLDHPTYYVSDPAWLNFSDERARSSLADQIFSPTEGVSRAVTLARSHGISYIVVMTGWPSYRAWVSNGASLEGGSVLIDTDSLLVISTSG